MKQKSIFFTVGAGALALLLIVAIALSAAPNLFSDDPPQSGITAENISGDISIRRSGNNYTLKDGIILYPGDEIMVGKNAQCEVIAQSRARVTMNQDSRLLIQDQTDDGLTLKVLEGVVFFDLIRSDPEGTVKVSTDYAVLAPRSDAIFSVEAYTGTQTVNVYRGTGSLRYEAADRELAEGEHVTMYQTDELNGVTSADILASELHPFLLSELIARDGLCFDAGRLRAIVEARRTDAMTAAEDRTGERKVCTIEIRCDTVLDKPEESGFTAPQGGMILSPTPVKFTQGDSAYDVLHRVCKAAGIKLDYNYLPMIGGYYVTGIAGLRETDYGASSGWLFKVNGWFPNYSVSRYEVEDGDVIVWMYSSEGGGADLGREEWSLHMDAVS